VRNKKDEVSSEAGDSGEETDEEDLQRANGMSLMIKILLRDWLKWQ
jgi:hypothetical protein